MKTFSESGNNDLSNPANRVPVAVVGARGYTGLELCRWILRHPGLRLAACFTGDEKFRLSDHLPESAAVGVPTHLHEALGRLAAEYSTVFLATPAEVSMELGPLAADEGADVIDLSGAFRLRSGEESQRKSAYQTWYALDHSALEWVERAEYGLVPWCGPARAKGKHGRLIANPGCYATTVLMALLPLLKAELIEPASIVIDAKSGTTGAGRKAEEHLLYSEVEGECLPYRVGKHPHLPEIAQWTEFYTGQAIDPFFTTSLLATRRGIIAGIYARLKGGAGMNEVSRAYELDYANYPLARCAKIELPAGKLAPVGLHLKSVVGSARVQIGYRAEGDKLYVFSLTDNLVKGAAGQALENLNRLQGWPVEAGLLSAEGLL